MTSCGNQELKVMFEKFFTRTSSLEKECLPSLSANFASVSTVAFGETERRSEWLTLSHIDCCETHKTVNTRNIYGMLLCCQK